MGRVTSRLIGKRDLNFLVTVGNINNEIITAGFLSQQIIDRFQPMFIFSKIARPGQGDMQPVR